MKKTNEVTEYWREADKYEYGVITYMISQRKRLVNDIMRITSHYTQKHSIMSFDEVNILCGKITEWDNQYSNTAYPTMLGQYILKHRRIKKELAMLMEYLIVYSDFQSRVYHKWYISLDKAIKRLDSGGKPLPTENVMRYEFIKLYGQSIDDMLSNNADYYMQKIAREATRLDASGESLTAKQCEIMLKKAFNDLLAVTPSGHLFGMLDRAYLCELGVRRIEELKRNNVKRVRFVAVLDNATTDECRGLNGFIFDVDKLVIGKNAPPIYPPPHPCRSRLIPVKED